MKFDDRLATVLRGDPPTGAGASVQYCQLIDILGRNDASLNARQCANALSRLHALHECVTTDDRLVAVQSLAGNLRSLVLLRYLASERHDIANAAIWAARLGDEEWALLVPDLPVRARGFLRNRRDLGPETMRALAVFGRTDMSLPQTRGQSGAIDREPRYLAANDPGEEHPGSGLRPDDPLELEASDMVGAAQSGSKIGELVARIEAFRRARADRQDGAGNVATRPEEPIERFTFECDAAGKLVWADGVALQAVYGLNIARVVQGASQGVDRNGAATFSKRMPMEAVRLELYGADAVSGSWRIDAHPFFDGPTGRFMGYRGVIRRPKASEDASGVSAVSENDQIAQLVHELRTPLNAILGFAEIIEQQLFGPAAFEYRSLAEDIMRDAHYLLAGFDDLNTALKLDAGRFDADAGSTAADWLKARLKARLANLAREREVALTVTIGGGLNGFGISQTDAERLALRLVGTAITLMGTGETASVKLGQGDETGQATIAINYPECTRNISETDLLDPEFGMAGEIPDAPLMGVGFSFRLVRSLAQTHGGSFDFGEDRIVLTLPAIAHSPEQKETAAENA